MPQRLEGTKFHEVFFVILGVFVSSWQKGLLKVRI